jgi:hypothetical protein
VTAPPPAAAAPGAGPALARCLDDPLAARLGDADRQRLRPALGRASPEPAGAGATLVADGVLVGRVRPYGSVVLYRPDAAAPGRHRLLEVDRHGAIGAVLARGPAGELRAAWIAAPGGGAVGVLPGSATHPLWGAADSIVRADGPDAVAPLTVAGAVDWGAIDHIPALAEPAALPPGAGAALLNLLAALAADQGRGPLRYRGPYPTEQLFWSLLESFRAPGPDALARFVAGAESTFAAGAPREAPLDWVPAPHERLRFADGLVVQLRDGVEKVTWAGRVYHRTEWPGFRRREHRVVRTVETGDGPRYVAGLQALGRPIEDHVVLDARGEPLERRAARPEDGPVRPMGPPWEAALAALVPLEATPLLGSAIAAVWPAIRLAWAPVPGDLVDARAGAVRVSPKLADAYRAVRDAAPAAARRGVARELVREVLGLVGPAVRQAATAWLAALPPGRQEAELAAGAAADRRARAGAAGPLLARLLDALEAGAALPD